ncbi:hypothetical protein VE03_10614 [Pseudogymnoascus sp. 23342-1-I1]|nr:hypothetical protein VE03_10614 [Pseudogymnoascus sp. 23342-1-I1]
MQAMTPAHPTSNTAYQFAKANSKYMEEMKILEAEKERLRLEIEEVEKWGIGFNSLDNHFKVLQEDQVKSGLEKAIEWLGAAK